MKCLFLALPGDDFDRVLSAVRDAARDSRLAFDFVQSDISQALHEKVASHRIAEADLVVALLTNTSVNVYFEVGIAHALGKPVVLLTSQTNKRMMVDNGLTQII